jgi:hypothetical protein
MEMMKMKPPFEGQYFTSFAQWVVQAKHVLTAHPEFNDTEHGGEGWRGYHFKAMCFDSLGRRCRNGGDFERANKENAFPVWWVWPDQIPQLVETAERAT